MFYEIAHHSLVGITKTKHKFDIRSTPRKVQTIAPIE